MTALDWISAAVIPLALCLLLGVGLWRGVPVFETFLSGAKEGLEVSVRVLPALVAIMTAVSMLRASGALDALTGLIQPVASALGIPGEILPLAVLRPISGSGSLAIVDHLLSHYHPDSFVGRVASVMQGSTETTFYTIAVYYGATRVKKTGETLPAAMSGDLVGVLISAMAVRWLMM